MSFRQGDAGGRARITPDALKVLSVESSVKAGPRLAARRRRTSGQAKAWAKRLEKERKLG